MTVGLDPRIVRRLADMNAVYRMYGHTGELLYIGMTGQLRRFDNHAMKRWFPQVSRITLEWHQTEAAARVSERRAIRAERPRYNIADTPKARRARVAAEKLPPAIPASRLVLEEEPDRDVLLDVLRVFGDRPGLHWQMLADLLADQIPSRWDGTTRRSYPHRSGHSACGASASRSAARPCRAAAGLMWRRRQRSGSCLPDDPHGSGGAPSSARRSSPVAAQVSVCRAATPATPAGHSSWSGPATPELPL
jgi:hypothetical protein